MACRYVRLLEAYRGVRGAADQHFTIQRDAGVSCARNQSPRNVLTRNVAIVQTRCGHTQVVFAERQHVTGDEANAAADVNSIEEGRGAVQNQHGRWRTRNQLSVVRSDSLAVDDDVIQTARTDASDAAQRERSPLSLLCSTPRRQQRDLEYDGRVPWSRVLATRLMSRISHNSELPRSHTRDPCCGGGLYRLTAMIGDPTVRSIRNILHGPNHEGRCRSIMAVESRVATLTSSRLHVCFLTTTDANTSWDSIRVSVPTSNHARLVD